MQLGIHHVRQELMETSNPITAARRGKMQFPSRDPGAYRAPGPRVATVRAYRPSKVQRSKHLTALTTILAVAMSGPARPLIWAEPSR